MSSTGRAAFAALVVVVGMLGNFGATSTAGAQRSNPRVAYGPPPEPPRAIAPYPGATTINDPNFFRQRFHERSILSPGRRFGFEQREPVVVYVPIPSDYGYYPQGGYVYDTNGRPLWLGYEAHVQNQPRSEYPHGTPDFSGSPYAVVDGGVMVVDFGNNDRRPIPSCARQESAASPDGKPRTIFYRPAEGGLVLRAGQRGRVIGTPTAGANVCYTVDQYGRMVLDY